MGYSQQYDPQLIERIQKRNAKKIALLNRERFDNLPEYVTAWIEHLLTNENILLLVTDSYRTFEYQDYLYQKYLAGGPVAAPPGESWHNYGMAIDVVPIEPGSGSADYNTPYWNTIHNTALQWWANETGAGFGDNPHLVDNFGYSPSRCENGLCGIHLFKERFYKDKPYTPPNSFLTAGLGNWLLLGALMGVVISEDLKKK